MSNASSLRVECSAFCSRQHHLNRLFTGLGFTPLLDGLRPAAALASEPQHRTQLVHGFDFKAPGQRMWQYQSCCELVCVSASPLSSCLRPGQSNHAHSVAAGSSIASNALGGQPALDSWSASDLSQGNTLPQLSFPTALSGHPRNFKP